MKKIVIATILLLALGFTPSAFSEENRGITMKVKTLAKNNEAGKQWVFLIGINKYIELEPLKNPVKDLKEISKVLNSKYYIDETIELYDEKATKSNIIKTFRELQEKVKINDSLLIIYAGHGFLDKSSNTGSWIPVDGGKDELNQSNWIANTQIRGLIGNFKSRHILLISDSCFSGDILNKNRGLDISKLDNNYFSLAYQKVSRQVMTSGASEFVPDQSEFAQQLKMSLEGNNKPFIDPLMLFGEIRSGVRKTTPMLGSLDGTGHQEGGSFLLFLKDEKKPETKVVINEKKDDDKIEVSLENTYGSLSIRSKFNGNLFIDEKFISKVSKDQILSIKKLKTGSHKLEIKGDKVSEIKEVDIEENKLNEVNFYKNENNKIIKKEDEIVKSEIENENNKIVSLKGASIGDFLWKVFLNPEDKLSNFDVLLNYFYLLSRDNFSFSYLSLNATYWFSRLGLNLSVNDYNYYLSPTSSPETDFLGLLGFKYRLFGNTDNDFKGTLGLSAGYALAGSSSAAYGSNSSVKIKYTLDFDIPIKKDLSIYNRNYFLQHLDSHYRTLDSLKTALGLSLNFDNYSILLGGTYDFDFDRSKNIGIDLGIKTRF